MYFKKMQLEKIFEDAGYWICFSQSDLALLTTTYLLKKIPKLERIISPIDIDDVENFEWIDPLQKTITKHLNEPPHKTIWLMNTKVRTNGCIGLSKSLNREHMKMSRFRVLSDMRFGTDTEKSQLDLNDQIVQSVLRKDMLANYYRDGSWGSMRHILIKEDERIAIKECEHAFINTLVKGDISSLSWIESPNQFFDNTLNENKYKHCCYVYYAALNFRDIMLAYGQLASDSLPIKNSLSDCQLGMEFSGRLANGRRVMGILPSQALATTVIVEESFLWDVPDKWSLSDAVTVPVAYLTAYYALIVRGNLQLNEKVLIHSGSGGVGQAAISICLSYGCKIFTTVSSEEKRKYLMERFPQLEADQFFNSRDTSFEYQILNMTYSQGVDIVLNSLTGEKLQASIRCLGLNGRFLEIGKVDMAKNSSIGMQHMFKNSTFHGILLDVIFEDPKEMETLYKLFSNGIKTNVVQPLNSTIFSNEHVEDAFRYMSNGKHIGKILIEIRKEEEQINSQPSPLKIPAICKTYCNPNHVYLITGGLGGFGLELAKWLIIRGARKLVLTSRGGIKNGYQKRCIHSWKKMNIIIEVSTLDIGKENEAFDLIQYCRKIGHLDGIFHLAMVLRDSMFENQTVENFQEVAKPKYYGTLHLDNATKKLCENKLKWFVVFSSGIANCGNASQTNYAWANSAMERIIERRRADGLSGMAIQWGPVGDVGTIITKGLNNDSIFMDCLPQRISNCLNTLDLFLTWDYPLVSSYIKAELIKNDDEIANNILKSIAHILGVNDVDQLNMDANLGDLGIDSLMGVEIRQILERDFNVTLSIKDLRSLTLNRLQKLIEEGKDGETHSEATNENDANENNNFSTVNENVSQKQHLTQMFKLRIDFQDFGVKECLVKCNQIEDGPIAFFIHSIEGTWAPIKQLIKNCNFQVYCLQFVYGVPNDSVNSVAKHYIQEIKKVLPKGPYNIIGVSYSGCIALEMVNILQEQDGPDSVSNFILIEGAYLDIKHFKKTCAMALNISNDADLFNHPAIESEMLCAVAIRCANVNYKKFKAELMRKVDYHERMQTVVDAVMEMGLIRDPKSIEFFCEALKNKYVIADKYYPERKTNGKIIIVRSIKENDIAANDDVDHENVNEIFDAQNLAKMFDFVEFYNIDCEKNLIIQGKNEETTANLINSIICCKQPCLNTTSINNVWKVSDNPVFNGKPNY